MNCILSNTSNNNDIHIFARAGIDRYVLQYNITVNSTIELYTNVKQNMISLHVIFQLISQSIYILLRVCAHIKLSIGVMAFARLRIISHWIVFLSVYHFMHLSSREL